MTQESKKPYLQITFGMSGYFVVLVAWYESDNMWDIAHTGIGRYATRAEAEQEAKEWSRSDEIEFRDS